MNPPAGATDERTRIVADALDAHSRWLRTVLAARGVERDCARRGAAGDVGRALRGAGSLRDVSKMAPWLYRIAVMQALAYRRRTGRRRKLTVRYAECGAAPCEAVDADPLAWLLAEEVQQLVRRAVAEQSPRDAEILLLKYTEGWSYRQLAEHLGDTVSAVERDCTVLAGGCGRRWRGWRRNWRRSADA